MRVHVHRSIIPGTAVFIPAGMYTARRDVGRALQFILTTAAHVVDGAE